MQNTPNISPWFAHATIKIQKLQTAGSAANHLRSATMAEVNALQNDLRRGVAKSPTGIDALKAGLADAQHRLALAEASNQARLGLAERAAKVIEACLPFQTQHANSVVPAPKKKSLSAVRDEILKISGDMRQVKNAIRPVEDIESDLRQFLHALTKPRETLISLCADVLSTGAPVTSIISHPNVLAPAAYGMALAAAGIDSILAEAATRNKAKKSSVLRLPPGERAERLAALAATLYALEIEEEQLLDDHERTPGVNAAAVLLVPLDVARAAGLLGDK